MILLVNTVVVVIEEAEVEVVHITVLHIAAIVHIAAEIAAILDVLDINLVCLLNTL